MPVTLMKGDLFDVAEQRHDLHALAFGTDIGGALSAGIASAFRARFPAFAVAYQAHCEAGMQMGDVFEWRDGNRVVYALGIQRPGSKPTMSAFERAMNTMLAQAAAAGVQGVHLPRIGGGKDGLDQLRVKRVINEAAAKTTVNLIVFEQFVRAAARPPEPS